MLGTTEKVSKLMGFKSTVAYKTTELDKSNALVGIFVWKLSNFLSQDFKKAKNLFDGDM